MLADRLTQARAYPVTRNGQVTLRFEDHNGQPCEGPADLAKLTGFVDADGGGGYWPRVALDGNTRTPETTAVWDENEGWIS